MRKFIDYFTRKKVVMSDADRVRASLCDELQRSKVFSEFIVAALRRGYIMEMTVEVDGVCCEIGVVCQAGDALVEYLANWAVSVHIKKQMALIEFDRISQDRSESKHGQ